MEPLPYYFCTMSVVFDGTSLLKSGGVVYYPVAAHFQSVS